MYWLRGRNLILPNTFYLDALRPLYYFYARFHSFCQLQLTACLSLPSKSVIR